MSDLFVNPHQRFRQLVVMGLFLVVSANWAVRGWSQDEVDAGAGASAPVKVVEPASAVSTETEPEQTISTEPKPADSKPKEVEPSDPAEGEPLDPATMPPLELNEEEQQLVDSFDAQHAKLVTAIAAMRETYLNYMNGVDSSRQAEIQYREKRNEVREQMNATYDAALDIIRRLPHPEAVQFVLTWIQHRESTDIYDAGTYEGAARLIDGGFNYLFLFNAAARSAVVSGQFEKAKLLLETIEKDKLEKHDAALLYQLEELEKNFNREQEFIKMDSENTTLPQVKMSTTRGDVVIELFADQAPNTVANFVSLVDNGFYDGLDFYQVIDHLLALTGDPSGNGSGNSGKYIADEHDTPDARPPMRGSLMMAKLPMGESGEFVPNSASSQFAILLLPLAHARNQTVFGRVISGMDVISSLRRVDPNKEKGKKVQVPPDRILTAEVIRRPATPVEPKYITLGR